MKYTSLLLCALPLVTVGALTSCNRDESGKVDTEELVIPQAPDVPQATATERAALLELVSLVPADSSLVFSLSRLPEHGQAFQNSHVGRFIENSNMDTQAPDMTEGDDNDVEEVDSAEVDVKDLVSGENSAPPTPVENEVGVKNVAVALGKGGERSIQTLARLNKALSKIQTDMAVAEIKDKALSPDEISQAYINALCENPDFLHLDAQTAPLTFFVEFDPESVESLKEQVNQGLALATMFGQGALKPIEFSTGGVILKGYHIEGEKLVALAQMGMAAGQVPADTAQSASPLLKEIAMDIVMGFKGNILILSISGDASRLKLPETPEQSILANPNLHLVDSHLKDSPALLGYVAPELMPALIAAAQAEYGDRLESTKACFNALAERDKYDASKVQEVTQAYASLSGLADKFFATYDTATPITAFCWTDAQGINLEAHRPSNALEYNWADPVSEMTGALSLPNTAIVTLSSVTPEGNFMFQTLLQSGASIITNWIELADKAGKLDSVDGDIKMITEKSKKLQPLVATLCKVMTETAPALGTKMATVLDFRSKNEANGAVKTYPRAAVAFNVKDRKAVEDSLDKVTTSLATCSKDSPCLSKVDWGNPTVTQDKDKTTWYKYQSADTGNAPVLTTAVARYRWAIGSDCTLTRSFYDASIHPDMSAIQPAAYGPTGLAVQLNIPQFVPWVRTISDTVPALEGVDRGEIASLVAAISEDISSIHYTVSQENGETVERIRLDKAQ